MEVFARGQPNYFSLPAKTKLFLQSNMIFLAKQSVDGFLDHEAMAYQYLLGRGAEGVD